jgi:hypothetical protein
MTSATITSEISASEVSELIGHDLDVLKAMVRAESYGSAMAHGVRIMHKGYVHGSVEFNAGTATYRLQY